MTEPELRSHPLWKLCTTKEQEAMLEYLRTEGDIVAAVMVGYGVTSPKSIDYRCHKLQDSPRTSRLMMAIDNMTEITKEDVERAAWLNAKTSESSKDRNEALRFVAQLKGWSKEAAPSRGEQLAELMEQVDKQRQ